MEGINKALCKKILTTTAIFLCTLPFAWANTNSSQSDNKMEINVRNDIKIRGKVIDNTGQPVIGATVQEKGTSVYAITDSDGRFTIDSKAGAKLIISCIGFKEVETIASQDIKITLSEDSELLSEVVVVGYGKQKKSSLTGSIASVDVQKTLDSRPIADVGRGLQGAVAGLNVNIPTGEVGSDPVMKIRGQIGSLAGSSAPLILLDNVEIPSITMVNPDDIKSISVLKDAAAASIYGSKAAFGVILITTKSTEKNDKVQVTYSNNFSFQNPAKKIEMGKLDAIKYLIDAANNRNYGHGEFPGGFGMNYTEETYQKAKEWQEKYGDTVKWNDPVLYGRDWTYSEAINRNMGYRMYDGVKAMIRSWAPTQTHNLSVNGVSGNTSYNLGFGYLNQSGMAKPAKHDDFQRYNISLGFNSKLNKWLGVRASAMFSDRNKRYPGAVLGADPWLYLYRWSVLMPIGVADGNTGNPLREPTYDMSHANTNNLRNQYFNASLGTTIQFTDNWDLQIDYTYDTNNQEHNKALFELEAESCWYGAMPLIKNGNQVYVDDAGVEYYLDKDSGHYLDAAGNQLDMANGMPAYQFKPHKYIPDGTGKVTDSYLEESRAHSENHTLNAYTTYDLLLGSAGQHALKFMAGMNMVGSRWNTIMAKRNHVINNTNPQFNFALGEKDMSGDRTWSSRLGFFGRFNYSFDNRYFIEGNIRYDGSSKFPGHLRWKWFPSVSGGWVFTNEKFMKPIENVLSFGKIRASWGSIGDQTIPGNLYVSQIPMGEQTWLDEKGNKTIYAGMPTIVNSDITWQMINTLDVGVDLKFWKNQIGVIFDWYQRDTENMIIKGDELPSTLGTSVPKGNYGNLRTNGWELTLDFNHRFRNGLGLNAAFAISDATTVITKGADWQIPWENRSIDSAYATGRRFGDIYGYVTDRLYQKDDFVYDENGQIEKIFIVYKGTKRTTHRQTAENPVYQPNFEDSNKLICSPGDVKFVDLNEDGYIDDGHRTNGDHGDLRVIGNSTPRYEYSFKLGADWKGIDFSIFFQGIGKRDIWGSGQLATPGYNLKDGCVPLAFCTDYWTEDNTDAFYPRAWDLGGSDQGFTYRIQTRYLMDMSYLRIKNITLGYSVPTKLLNKINMSKIRCYVSLENFFTFDNLHGRPIDPEAISGFNMMGATNYNLGRTGTGAPTFKSASVGVQLSF